MTGQPPSGRALLVPGGPGERVDRPVVVVHDGSQTAEDALARAAGYATRLVAVYRSHWDPPASLKAPNLPSYTAVGLPQLTLDLLMRTAREYDAPYVVVPDSLLRPERVLVAGAGAAIRLGDKRWPAVAVHVVRGTHRGPWRRLLAVVRHRQSSGSLALVAAAMARVSGADLDVAVVGAAPGESVAPGRREDDFARARDLIRQVGVRVRSVELGEPATLGTLGQAVERSAADVVIVGVSGLAMSRLDFSPTGRRQLLRGPLRVEHTVLRRTPADVVVVFDSVTLRSGYSTANLRSSTVEFFLGHR